MPRQPLPLSGKAGQDHCRLTSRSILWPPSRRTSCISGEHQPEVPVVPGIGSQLGMPDANTLSRHPAACHVLGISIVEVVSEPKGLSSVCHESGTDVCAVHMCCELVFPSLRTNMPDTLTMLSQPQCT